MLSRTQVCTLANNRTFRHRSEFNSDAGKPVYRPIVAGPAYTNPAHQDIMKIEIIYYKSYSLLCYRDTISLVTNHEQQCIPTV